MQAPEKGRKNEGFKTAAFDTEELQKGMYLAGRWGGRSAASKQKDRFGKAFWCYPHRGDQ